MKGGMRMGGKKREKLTLQNSDFMERVWHQCGGCDNIGRQTDLPMMDVGFC